MPDLYDECDIFVNTSIVDNQPVSVLEALAAGLPVVSTATGDISAMLCEGKAGLIIPPADPGALAKAVASLWEDPDRARLMAARARQEVERYTWDQVSKEWASVYAGEEQ
jgi:glycosyltransferase involved in cell wall biosynthesis